MIDLSKPYQPKNDLQAEMRILGTLIGLGSGENPICYEILTLMDKGLFYNQNTRDLFVFIVGCYEREAPFDFTSILNAVPSELTSLLCEVAGDGSYFSKNLYQQDMGNLKMLKGLRLQMAEMYSIWRDLTKDNVPATCCERLADGIGIISTYSSDTETDCCRTYEQIADEILSSDDVETELKLNLETWPALPSSGMISIAGRSGVGKTFMAIYLMEQITQVCPDKQALYFNLEMDEKVMIHRHAGIIGKTFDSLKQTIRVAAPELLTRGVGLITDTQMTIEKIELIVRSKSMKKPISVIVVDYIGLVQAKKKYDREDLKQGDIAQRLAALALDHNCIVLALLQVNREHKNRVIGNKCPETTDASESMGTVKSSEWWIGLDQPQLDDPDNEQYKDLFIIKNRKSRGKAGYFTVYMEFKDGKFTEINQEMAKFRMTPAAPLRPMRGRGNYPD